MMHRNAFLLAVSATIMMSTVCGVRAADNMPARILLKSKKTLDVTLLNRRGSDWIRLNKANEDTDINFPVSDISGIAFKQDLKESGVDTAYEAGGFKKAAEALKKMVEPTFPYLDIPNNGLPNVILLAKSYYWDRQYTPCMQTCDVIIGKSKKQPYLNQAKTLKAAALVELNKIDEAEAIIKGISAPPRKEEQSAMYWFVLSKIQMAKELWSAAQESAGTIVAFYPKDYEWMPAGLYLAAKGYIQTGAYEVASQVIEDIQLAYPDSTWSKKTDDLQQELNRKKRAEKKAAEEAAEEEE